MILLGVDVSGDLVGVGTLLVGVGTLLTALDGRRRTRKVEHTTGAIQETVNGNLGAERARNDALTHTVVEAGLPLPPVPEEPEG